MYFYFKLIFKVCIPVLKFLMADFNTLTLHLALITISCILFKKRLIEEILILYY